MAARRSASRTVRPLKLLACCLIGCLPLPAISQAQELPAGEAIMERMLDRLAARLRQRSDLRDRLSPAFDKDSVGHYGLKGLSRSEDSTVIGWFTGFAEMLQ